MVEVDVPSNSGRMTLDPMGGMASMQVHCATGVCPFRRKRRHGFRGRSQS